MKWWTWLLAAIAALLLMLALLIWFLPATWAVPFVAARLHGAQLRDVHGQLWDGAAGQVLGIDGQPMGRLQWQLSRRALLGRVLLHLRLKGPWLEAEAYVDRPGWPTGVDVQTRLHDVRLRTEPAAWPAPPATPLGAPRGTFDVRIGQATLRGNWPVQLVADVQWHDAAVHAAYGDVTLGRLAAHLQGSNGLIDGLLQDDGHGHLGVRGRFLLSPFGWRFEAALRPRSSDADLSRWLGQWGRPDAQGVIHIQRSAGLAAALPPTQLPKETRP